MLFHHLKKSRLRLGRRPVELIGQHDVVHDGAGQDLEFPFGGAVNRQSGDVGRCCIRCALDSCKGEGERIRQCLCKGRLPHARDILEEEVTAGEKSENDLVDHVPFADDTLFHIPF